MRILSHSSSISICHVMYRAFRWFSLVAAVILVAFIAPALAKDKPPVSAALAGLTDPALPAEGRLLQLPQDNTYLQGILTQELETGSPAHAFRIGLAYLDLEHLSETNLFLVIQAARLSGVPQQARQISTLAIRYHPDNMDLYIQHLGLYALLGNCGLVMRGLGRLRAAPPTSKAATKLARYRTQLDELHEQCTEEWQTEITTGFGMAYAPLAGTSPHGGAIIAKPGSALDDICVVLTGLCPANRRFDLPQPKHHQLAQLSAHVTSHQTRHDGTHKIIGLNWYQERALSGKAQSAQLVWHGGYGRVRKRGTSWLSLLQLQAVSRQDTSSDATPGGAANQMTYLQPGLGVRTLSPAYGPFRSEMSAGLHHSLLPSGLIRHLQTEMSLSVALTRKSGVRLSSLGHWQNPPHANLAGRSITRAEKMTLHWHYSPDIRIVFSHLQSTTRFAKTLPYLLKPHQIKKQENQLKIEYDITQNWSIYASILDQNSRSEDQISQFSNQQHTLGISRKY